MKKLALMILMSGMAVGQAGDSAGFHDWTKGQIEQMETALAPQMDAHKFKSSTIATEGNHRFVIVHREGPGQSEYHATESDIVFFQSGHATLTYGGKMVGATETAPNEQRGSGIEGGTEKAVGVGDVFAIPAKMPHMVTPLNGETVNYFVVKVTEP